MGAALQVVNTFKQSLTGSGTFDTFAPGTGDSLTFYNVPQGSGPYLSEVWAVDDAGPIEVSLTASRFHDQLFGLLGLAAEQVDGAGNPRASCISPVGFDQPIYPSDVLTVRGADQASGNANIVYVVYYPDLPGIAASMRTYEAVKAATVNLVGVHVSLDASSGPGQGDWSQSVSLSAASRRLDAGRKYAVLGFTSDVPAAAVALSSFETGNLRIGGPVVADPDHDAYLLADLARVYSSALIPVIDGSNQDSVMLQCADPAATNVEIDVMLAELQGL